MARRPTPDEDTEEGALQRWSRRKRESLSNGEAAQPVGETSEEQERETAGTDPAPAKTDADMPDVDTINDASDISEFFSSGVSTELRNKALRRLFHLPKYNVVDGLDDYDDDFRNFELLGNIVTADMRHREEMKRLAEEDTGEQPQDPTIASEDAEPATAMDEPDEYEEKTDSGQDEETVQPGSREETEVAENVEDENPAPKPGPAT